MMKVQVPMWSTASDAELQFYREMGVEYISVMFHENDWDYERVSRLQERMAKFDLKITDAGSFSVFKNPIIHLGLEGGTSRLRAITSLLRLWDSVRFRSAPWHGSRTVQCVPTRG